MIKNNVSLEPSIKDLIDERKELKNTKATGLISLVNKEKRLLELDRKIADLDVIKREN